MPFPSLPSAPAISPVPQARILVVEEQFLECEYLRMLLTQAGYAVEEAHNGAEALERLRKNIPDLLVCDLLMPMTDGFEFFRRIRSDPRLAAMRVMFWTTSFHEDQCRQLAKGLGAHFISKQSDAANLVAAVEGCLQEPLRPVLQGALLKQLEAAHQRLMADQLADTAFQLKKVIAERLVADALLHQTQQRFAGIIDSAIDAVIGIDNEQRIVLFNAGAETMFGYPASQVLGQPVESLMPERFRTAHVEHVRRFLESGTTVRRMGALQTLWGLRADGEEFPIEASISIVPLDGDLVATVIVRDVSARVKAEKALRESEARLRRFYDSGLLGVIYWSTTGQVTDANDKFLEMVGYSRDDLQAGRIDWQNMTPPEFRDVDEASVRELLATGVNARPFEKEYFRKDGSRLPVLVAGATLDEARTQGVAFVLDISELKEAQEQLRTAALHDPLTGLPNRALFFEYGERMLAAAARSHGETALFFIDLDRFKPINDTFGHDAGDAVLKTVAERLAACTRQADLVGRLGGDEFVILLTHSDIVRQREAVVAEHVLERVSQPIQFNGHILHVTPSIGISRFPEHGADLDTLIRAADLAMYHAKHSGQANYKLYTPELRPPDEMPSPDKDAH